MVKKKRPELLAPAGDLEKLKIAVLYGADAVYIGGQNLGLRAKAKNFEPSDMEAGIAFAHQHGAKVYVTANIFAHNQDFEGIEQFFVDTEKIGVDALIISDPGIFSVARAIVPNMEIHISTQANNTNARSALFWKQLGAKRVVLARELSIQEISEIADWIPDDLELETFVHGAMCISYSGRCLLSNYFSNRDSNRGLCSQPCRWEYYLMEKNRANEFWPVFEDERGTYIFNSKDLCLVQYIPELINAGIASFKIEGRMKTPYYVGTVVKAYREAIDDFWQDPALYESKKDYYFEELQKCSHRDYTTGFYFDKPKSEGQVYSSSSYIRTYDFLGMVLDYDPDSQMAIVEQRNKMVLGDEVEFFSPTRDTVSFVLREMWNDRDEPITEAPHPQQIIKLKTEYRLERFDMIRKGVKGIELAEN